MAFTMFCDFDELTTLRAIPISSDAFELPVDEGLYVDIWRHLSASYRDSDRSNCPGFVSYAVTMLKAGCMVSNPLVPRYDLTSSLVQRTITALLQVMSDVQASDVPERSYDTVIFTSFDINDFTKVTLDPGMFFRDASSTVIYYYRLAEIIASYPPTRTLCIAYKQKLCVVLQNPLLVPTCTHPFVNQTTALARVLNTPNLFGFTMQTTSDLPYPYVLVAGQRASFMIRPSGTSLTRVRTCDVGLADSSGGVIWSPVEWSFDDNASGVGVIYALNVANITKVHVFRLGINDDAVVISYTHPRQHASLPKCTGISCTAQTTAFYQSIRFQCLFNGTVPDGAKWSVRILSSTGHLFETSLAPVLNGTSCVFDYTVESGSTNAATVTLSIGKLSQMSSWRTSLASPFVFGA